MEVHPLGKDYFFADRNIWIQNDGKILYRDPLFSSKDQRILQKPSSWNNAQIQYRRPWETSLSDEFKTYLGPEDSSRDLHDRKNTG